MTTSMKAEPTDADLVEAFGERAAIMEYDGEFSRSMAEFKAANEMRKRIAPRKLPDEILRIVRSG